MENPAQMVSNAYIAWQESKRYKDLEAEAKKLDRTPAPSYELNPALTKAYEQAQSIYDKAQGAAAEGFTEPQRNKFDAAIAGQNAIMARNAMETGGGQMGQYVGAMNTANALSAITDFAAQDAMLKEQKQRYADSLFGTVMSAGTSIQNQQNIIQGEKIRRRMLLEQALGRGMSDTRSRMYGAMNNSAVALDQEIQGAQDAAMMLTGTGAFKTGQPKAPAAPGNSPMGYGGQEVIPGYNDYSTFTG